MVNQATSNRQIIENIQSDLLLNEGADVIPRYVEPKIQPVYEVNNKFQTILRNAARTTTGVSTIFTTPADRDFFLCTAALNGQMDVTNDATSWFIRVTIDGTARFILISKLTTTATSENQIWTFNPPLKPDRSTNITLETTFTAGTANINGTISGFLAPPSSPQRFN